MKRYDPRRHARRSMRLKGHDYSQPGAYFVTVVAWQRECLFGEIENGEMRLNEFGEIVAETWKWLPNQYPYIELGAWIVMPNHVHGIIVINDLSYRRGASRRAPTTVGKIKPLGQLVGAFKTLSSKRINLMRDSVGVPVWQRNFYEHIIRDEQELERIHAYIVANPFNWKIDEENR